MKAWSIIMLVLVTLGIACACPLAVTEASDDELVIMSWNVQNLMDGITDGTEYDEYLPKNGWTDALYRKRLRLAMNVLTDKSLPLAHVLVFQEIEHEGVLRDLLDGILGRYGFQWYASTREPDSAIQIGVASRLPIAAIRIHAVPEARPVLECEFHTSKGVVVVLAVHGKSRKEGEFQTETKRIALARTLTMVRSQWAMKDPMALVLAVGDFNASPGQQQSWQTIFIQATHPMADEYMNRGSMCVSGFQSMLGSDMWYSPSLDPSLWFERPGSCWFSGAWHQFDQILGTNLLFDRQGWDFSASGIGVLAANSSSDGTPLAWNRYSDSGVSDHFPVWMKLK